MPDTGELKQVELPEDLIPGELDLTTVDGNAFSIMGAVSRVLRRAGNPQEIIDAYTSQAMDGDYDHLLRVSIAFTETPDE